jgi:subfamily B ATP-binding cassette protein MsbA
MSIRDKLGVLIEYLAPYRKRLLAALGMTIVVTLLSLLPPLIMSSLIDDVIAGGQWDRFWIIVTMLSGVFLCHQAFRFVNNYVISTTAQNLVFDIRTGMYRHLQRLPLQFFDRHNTGSVVERLMGDVANVQSMISNQMIQLLMDVITAGFCISVMFIINWQLALIVLCLVPLYLLNYHFFVPRIRSSHERFREKMDDVSGMLQERLNGTALVKAYGQERKETRVFASEAFQAMKNAVDARGRSVFFSNVAESIEWLGRTSVFVVGCCFVINRTMEYGDVYAFILYATLILDPAVRLSIFVNEIEQTLVSVDRVKEILSESHEPGSSEVGSQLKSVLGHVQFQKLWFAYESDLWVLRDINLDVPAGATVALVGHTGCGKTTITSLLYRFYEPTRGRIMIDGQDITGVKVSDLRRQLALVTQDVVVFEGGVAENIAYGSINASRDQIIEAAKIAEIHDYIETLPDGYDTVIGEEGAKLSVGQRQRLVIARAVLTNPAILIMDEATSSLDTESERLIQKALERIMATRTCFIVAHRLSTIVNADLIVVMDDGRIVESGKHSELLQREGGHYRALYETQFSMLNSQEHTLV